MKTVWALLGFLGWVTTAQAAVTWYVVENADCTAPRAATVSGVSSAAVNCCTGATMGFCNRRTYTGELYEVAVYAIASGTYTTGGDVFDVTQLAKIQMSTIVHAQCNLANNGVDPPTAVYFPDLLRTSPLPSLQLFQAGAAEVPNGALLTGTVFNCLVKGF